MRKFAKSLLLGIFILSLNSAAHAAVWKTTHQWNSDWEAKFTQWVSGPEWNKDFFVQAGPFQGLKLDCADAVYSMRFIFAAKNGLPFVIKDPTGGKKNISNEMTRWDSQSENQRLRSFLVYIFQVASTSSLPNDTYPVAVTRAGIGSGALILTDAKSRHTWTIKYISETGVPLTISRSRPPTTPMFQNYEFPPAEYVFSGGMSPERNSGFRRFRQPSSIGQPVWKVPGYSIEQYSIPLAQFNDVVQKKLAVKKETTEQRMSRILEGACQAVRDRAVVVTIANNFLLGMSNQCMNDSQFDDYSTPSRDKRIKMVFTEFEKEAQSARGKISDDLQAKIDNVLLGEKSANTKTPYCTVEVADKLSLTLGQAFERELNGKMSSSPHDTLKMRWGFESFPSARAKHCGR